MIIGYLDPWGMCIYIKNEEHPHTNVRHHPVAGSSAASGCLNQCGRDSLV